MKKTILVLNFELFGMKILLYCLITLLLLLPCLGFKNSEKPTKLQYKNATSLNAIDHENYNPINYGAVGDYYLANGAVNPAPTDDTVAVQAAIDATRGNGCITITKAFYCTRRLNVSGILGIKSPLVPALYNKSKLGIKRPYAIINKTTDLFRVNPLNAQSGIHMQGVTFIGNGSNKMFDTSKQVPIHDYFNVQASGCDFKKFGKNAIDGSLGSWLWKFDNCGFEGDTAVYLYQPHGAVIEKCGFNFRNRRDLYAHGGVSFVFRDNACDFDVAYKEVGLEFSLMQSALIEGNYAEEYHSSGKPLVNGGDGTYVNIFTLGHYVKNNVPVVRNNYYSARDVQRLFTIKRNSAEENFYSTSSIKIYENSVNGLAGYYIYHDHSGDPAKTLTIPKPLIQTGQAKDYKIGDPNGSLRFSGPDAISILRYIYKSPTHNGVLSTASPKILRNDKNYTLRPNGLALSQSGATIELSFAWDSTVNVDFYVEITGSGANRFKKRAYRQTGKQGGGYFSHTIAVGKGSIIQIRLVNISGNGTVCDNFETDVTIKGINR